MKKLLYVFLLFALCVVGCSRKVDSRLVLADSLVENRPDSAYVILRSVNPDSLSGGENRALYSLLMSQAMYKCNVRAKNDSLINIAVDYYKSTDNRANYARSLLFKGAVLYEMGKKRRRCAFTSRQNQWLIHPTMILSAMSIFVWPRCILIPIFRIRSIYQNFGRHCLIIKSPAIRNISYLVFRAFLLVFEFIIWTVPTTIWM